MDFIVDGDIQVSFVFDPEALKENYPFSPLVEKGANVLIFPNLAAANIGYQLVQDISGTESVGQKHRQQY